MKIRSALPFSGADGCLVTGFDISAKNLVGNGAFESRICPSFG